MVSLSFETNQGARLEMARAKATNLTAASNYKENPEGDGIPVKQVQSQQYGQQKHKNRATRTHAAENKRSRIMQLMWEKAALINAQ